MNPKRMIVWTTDGGIERMRLTADGLTIIWQDEWPAGRIEHPKDVHGEVLRAWIIAGRGTDIDLIRRSELQQLSVERRRHALD